MAEPNVETDRSDACPSCGHVTVDAKFCDRCGTRLPVRVECGSCAHVNVDARFCDRCGVPLGDAMNPYAAPTNERVLTGDRPLASRGARLGAGLIDAICVSLVNFPLLLSAGLISLDGTQLPLSRMVLAIGLGFIVFVVVEGWFLVHGQTIGKRALGLRMVDADTGEPAPIGRLITLRYLPLSIVSLIPIAGSLISLIDVLFIFGSDRRCLHDLVANTRVIEDR